MSRFFQIGQEIHNPSKRWVEQIFRSNQATQNVWPRTPISGPAKSGKIRLTGNDINFRLFPVRQPESRTGRFLVRGITEFEGQIEKKFE